MAAAKIYAARIGMDFIKRLFDLISTRSTRRPRSAKAFSRLSNIRSTAFTGERGQYGDIGEFCIPAHCTTIQDEIRKDRIGALE